MGGASPPAGKALDILELVVLVHRRDERRAGDRPFAGRSRSNRHDCVQMRRLSGRPGENEWPVLLSVAHRGTAVPAPIPTAPVLTKPAQPAPGGVRMSWTPAFCSPTRRPSA